MQAIGRLKLGITHQKIFYDSINFLFIPQDIYDF